MNRTLCHFPPGQFLEKWAENPHLEGLKSRWEAWVHFPTPGGPEGAPVPVCLSVPAASAPRVRWPGLWPQPLPQLIPSLEGQRAEPSGVLSWDAAVMEPDT